MLQKTTVKNFQMASTGWFKRFKKRFKLIVLCAASQHAARWAMVNDQTIIVPCLGTYLITRKLMYYHVLKPYKIKKKLLDYNYPIPK